MEPLPTSQYSILQKAERSKASTSEKNNTMKIERATQLLITFAIASIPVPTSAESDLAEQKHLGLLRGAKRVLEDVALSPSASPTSAVSGTGTPEETAPDPDVPAPDAPDPEVPAPDAPDPDAPDVPAPDAPAPEPDVVIDVDIDQEVDPPQGPLEEEPNTGTVIVLDEQQQQQHTNLQLSVHNRDEISKNIQRPSRLWGRKPADDQTQNP